MFWNHVNMFQPSGALQNCDDWKHWNAYFLLIVTLDVIRMC